MFNLNLNKDHQRRIQIRHLQTRKEFELHKTMSCKHLMLQNAQQQQDSRIFRLTTTVKDQYQQTITYVSNSNYGEGLLQPDISVITPPSRVPYQNNNSPFNSVNKSGGSSLSLRFSPTQPAVSAEWMMTPCQLLILVNDFDNARSEEDWKNHSSAIFGSSYLLTSIIPRQNAMQITSPGGVCNGSNIAANGADANEGFSSTIVFNSPNNFST